MTKVKRAPCGSTSLRHRIAHKIGIVSVAECIRYMPGGLFEGIDNITEKESGNMSEIKRHYIADELLGGIEREYVEVERKASVGDYVHAVIFNHPYGRGRRDYVGKLNGYDEWNDALVKVVDGESIRVMDVVSDDGDYIVTLSPTNIIRHHGQRYEMVVRKAEVGEKVIVLDGLGEHHGKIGEVVFDFDESASVNIGDDIDYYPHVCRNEYHVLLPLEDSAQSPQSTDDIIANLVARLSKAERKIDELTEQVGHNTDNIRTWAGETESVKAKLGILRETNFEWAVDVERKIEMLTDDIVMLDERTSNRTVKVELDAEEIAQKVAEKVLIGGRSL